MGFFCPLAIYQSLPSEFGFNILLIFLLNGLNQSLTHTVYLYEKYVFHFLKIISEV